MLKQCLYDNEDKSAKWVNAVIETVNMLNLNLLLLHHRTLVGIQLIVLIKDELLPFVHEVRTSTVSTGVMNMLGNKGAVIIEFCVWTAYIKLIGVHLAAHPEQTMRRNVEVATIQTHSMPLVPTHIHPAPWHFAGISRTRYLDLLALLPHTETEVWSGDFNYRCTSNTMIYDPSLDQFAVERLNDRIFIGYEEGQINFPPSYKYGVGTNNISALKTPSWCDRIVFKGEGIQCEDYWSATNEVLSDHKPVLAQLTWSIESIDPDDLDKAFQIVLKEMDTIQNDAIPNTELGTNVLDLGEIAWKRLVERKVKLFNHSQMLVQFQVSNIPKWLRISPSHGFIGPESECELLLYVVIVEHTPIDEVVVIHVENGYDHFLNVFGTVRKTDFGMSLKTLCQPVEESLMEEGGTQNVVPRILSRLVNYLIKRDSLSLEIFTVSADRSLVAIMQDALDFDKEFDRELPLNSSESTVLVATGHMTLRFFDSLPEPLLPNEILLSSKEPAQAILDLSESTCFTFLYFADFLRQHIVKKDRSIAEALSTIFAQVLFRSDVLEVDTREEAKSLKRKAAFLMHFIS